MEVRGGALIQEERQFLNLLIRSNYKRRLSLLSKASKKQLLAVLQVGWNLTSHRRARLAPTHKALLKKYYSQLRRAFFEISKIYQLRRLLQTPGLINAILAPISTKSSQGVVTSAITTLLNGE